MSFQEHQKQEHQKETTAQNTNDDGIYTGFLPNGDFYVGTEEPVCGFATHSGEAVMGQSLHFRKGVPQRCLFCDKWIFIPNNHQYYSGDDTDRRIYCSKEYSEGDIRMCNACNFPEKVYETEVGYHTDYPGGSAAGGSSAGGCDFSGSAAGGCDFSGSAAGGSAAGGCDFSGSAAGGSSAGGCDFSGSAAGGYIPPLRRQIQSVLVDGNRIYVLNCAICNKEVYDLYGDSDRGYYCSNHNRYDHLGLSSPR